MSRPKIERNLKIVELKDKKGWTHSQIMEEFDFKAKSTVSSIYKRFNNPKYLEKIRGI